MTMYKCCKHCSQGSRMDCLDTPCGIDGCLVGKELSGSKFSDAEVVLVNKLRQVVGYVPMGLKDMLKVLTHPDLIDLTETYIREKRAAL